MVNDFRKSCLTQHFVIGFNSLCPTTPPRMHNCYELPYILAIKKWMFNRYFLPLLQFPSAPDHLCPLHVIVHCSSVRLHLTIRLSPTLFFHDPLGRGGSAHPTTAKTKQYQSDLVFGIKGRTIQTRVEQGKGIIIVVQCQCKYN